MVLDAETLQLAPRAAELIAASEGSELPGTLKRELFASALELNTEICESPAEARGCPRASYVPPRAVSPRSAACASRPRAATRSAGPRTQEIADESRYAEFVAYAGVSARRQGVSGLHVHVGMPSAEACFHALEGVLPWLPVVLALSANSPYLAGEETGHAVEPCRGARAAARGAAPRPPSRPTRSGRRSSTTSRGSGSAPTTRGSGGTSRPHPTFGTLEIRMPDQPTSLARHRRDHRAPAGALPDRARPASPRARSGRARPLPAEPLGSCALRARTRSSSTRTAERHRPGLGAGRRARRPARLDTDSRTRSRPPARGRTGERRRGRLRGPRRAHARLRACQSRRRRSR